MLLKLEVGVNRLPITSNLILDTSVLRKERYHFHVLVLDHGTNFPLALLILPSLIKTKPTISLGASKIPLIQIFE